MFFFDGSGIYLRGKDGSRESIEGGRMEAFIIISSPYWVRGRIITRGEFWKDGGKQRDQHGLRREVML